VRPPASPQVWKLHYPSLEWQRAEIAESSPQPARRRGHSTMHYRVREKKGRAGTMLPALLLRATPALAAVQAPVCACAPTQPRPPIPPFCAQDAEGVDHIVIFAGRTKHAQLLNDAWDVALHWPAASWRCITPQQPGAEGAPAGRRGHSAVLVSEPGAAEPQMVSVCV